MISLSIECSIFVLVECSRQMVSLQRLSFAVLISVSNVFHAIAGEIGFQDLRDSTERVVEAAPVAASNNSTAIIAYGGSDEVLNAIYQAAGRVAADLDQDIVFLTAPDNDDDPTRTDFAIFINGQMTATFMARPHETSTDYWEFNLRRWVQDGIEQFQ